MAKGKSSSKGQSQAPKAPSSGNSHRSSNTHSQRPQNSQSPRPAAPKPPAQNSKPRPNGASPQVQPGTNTINGKAANGHPAAQHPKPARVHPLPHPSGGNILPVANGRAQGSNGTGGPCKAINENRAPHQKPRGNVPVSKSPSMASSAKPPAQNNGNGASGYFSSFWSAPQARPPAVTGNTSSQNSRPAAQVSTGGHNVVKNTSASIAKQAPKNNHNPAKPAENVHSNSPKGHGSSNKEHVHQRHPERRGNDALSSIHEPSYNPSIKSSSVNSPSVKSSNINSSSVKPSNVNSSSVKSSNLNSSSVKPSNINSSSVKPSNINSSSVKSSNVNSSGAKSLNINSSSVKSSKLESSNINSSSVKSTNVNIASIRGQPVSGNASAPQKQSESPGIFNHFTSLFWGPTTIPPATPAIRDPTGSSKSSARKSGPITSSSPSQAYAHVHNAQRAPKARKGNGGTQSPVKPPVVAQPSKFNGGSAPESSSKHRKPKPNAGHQVKSREYHSIDQAYPPSRVQQLPPPVVRINQAASEISKNGQPTASRGNRDAGIIGRFSSFIGWATGSTKPSAPSANKVSQANTTTKMPSPNAGINNHNSKSLSPAALHSKEPKKGFATESGSAKQPTSAKAVKRKAFAVSGSKNVVSRTKRTRQDKEKKLDGQMKKLIAEALEIAGNTKAGAPIRKENISTKTTNSNTNGKEKAPSSPPRQTSDAWLSSILKLVSSPPRKVDSKPAPKSASKGIGISTASTPTSKAAESTSQRKEVTRSQCVVRAGKAFTGRTKTSIARRRLDLLRQHGPDLIWHKHDRLGLTAALATETAAPLPGPPKHELRDKALQRTISKHPELFKVITPIKAKKFERLLKNHPNQPFVKSVVRGLKEGFYPLADTSDPRLPRINDNSGLASELKGARGKFVREQRDEEIRLGRWSTGFKKLLPGMYVSPISAVPKKNPGEFRLVMDQSRGKHALNSMIPKKAYNIKLDNIKDFGNTLIEVRKKIGKDKKLEVFKSDVKSAYRQIPMHPLWQIKQAVKVDGKYHIDRCNTFGNRAGGWIWDSVISLVLWAGIKERGIKDLLGYVDDEFGWEYKDRKRYYAPYKKNLPAKQAKLLELWDELGIPHDESKQLSGPSLPIIGFEVNPNAMRIKLPAEKKAKVVGLLRDYAHTGKPYTLQELQSVGGSVASVVNLYPQLRPKLRVLFDEMVGKEGGETRMKVSKPVARTLSSLADYIEKAKSVPIRKIEGKGSGVKATKRILGP